MSIFDLIGQLLTRLVVLSAPVLYARRKWNGRGMAGEHDAVQPEALC